MPEKTVVVDKSSHNTGGVTIMLRVRLRGVIRSRLLGRNPQPPTVDHPPDAGPNHHPP